MKRLLLSLLSAMLILSVDAQTNLITNPGFETGDDTGWAGYNRSVLAAADAFEGDYVGAINDNQAGSFLYPSIAVTPGKTYKFAIAVKWPNGCSIDGVAMVVKSVSGNNTLAETPKINTTEWSVDSGEVIIPEGITEVKLVHWKPVSEICYIDSAVFYEVEGGIPDPDLVLSDDGEILEDFEDGEVITVSMTNDSFVDPITPANWTVNNLPEGVTIGAVTRLSGTEATLTLSGNTTGDYDADITDMQVLISADEFTNYEFQASVNTGVTFTANVEGSEEVVWEEDFSTWTSDVVLDSAYLAGMDFGTEGQPDSVKVIDGYVVMYTSELQNKNNWFKKYIELIPGMTYIYSADIKTPDAKKSFGVVRMATPTQIKASEVVSDAWTPTVAEFKVDPDRDTVSLEVYRWGPQKEVHIDNMKLVLITEPMIRVSTDGEILEGAEDGEIITVKVLYDTLVASPDLGNWSASALPEGVSLGGLNRVDSATLEITLAGNATSDYDADSLAVITGTRDEFVTSNKALSAGTVTFTAVHEEPAISLSDDGEILEGAEDMEIITVALARDTFALALTPGNWTVTNLPEGVSMGTVTRVDDITAEIALSGNATADYDEDITDVTVTVAGAELKVYDSEISANTGVTLKAIVEEPASITISDDGEIKEGAEDGEVITVSLSNDVFAATLSDANWTVTNLPAGVSKGTITRVGDNTAEITLSGNTTEDYDADITDVTVTVGAAELVASETDVSASTGVTLIADLETGIEPGSIAGLHLYPNPFINKLSISSNSKIESVRVFDLLGARVFEMVQVNVEKLELNTDSWNAGIYFVSIEDKSGNMSVIKVVK